MKLLIFGHSYVRDLRNLNIFKFHFEDITIDIKYSFWPGASYKKFLDNPETLKSIVQYKPDITIVILGGNAILKSVGAYELQHQCRQFYKLLRCLIPDSLIIAAQVELRTYKPENRFGSPLPAEFKRKRNNLNTFLKRLKLVDNLLIIAGPGRLDNPIFYRDGIHLNRRGLSIYFSILKSTVKFALNKRKQKALIDTLHQNLNHE